MKDRLKAGVAELADAQASGACGRKVVWVQVPSPALSKKRYDRKGRASFLGFGHGPNPRSEAAVGFRFAD